jgi:transposase
MVNFPVFSRLSRMDKEDARKLPAQAQHEKRKQSVRLHRQGYGCSQIATMTGLGYTSVRRTLQAFEQGGWQALEPKKRGRRVGAQRRLTIEQETQIQALICQRRPEQLGLRFALWSRQAVRQLIDNRFSICLPVRTVGEYLRRWGFTAQKPIVRAYERCDAQVRLWLDTQYPAIASQAASEGAQIHWADETALVNTDVRGRGFAPKGHPPVALAPAKREHLSMISAVSNQGQLRWLIIEGGFNADRLIEFMELLTRDAGKKVLLILDNLRVHHAKPVKAWLQAPQLQPHDASRMEVFYLPAYSPELNPDERLNADIKRIIGRRLPVRSKHKLRTTTSYYMRQIEQQPERIKSYFQDPACRYAA